MAIQKPFSVNIKDQIIDGKKDYLVKWSVSGDTSTSFAISIYNNQTGVLAWSLSRTYSFAMSYTISANSLPNGADYKIAITVWNNAGQSATSQFVVFTTSSAPVVTLPTIGTVGNHTYLFTATYSQAENSPVSTYTANLYSADKVLLKTSGIKSDSFLEHRFDLMKNNTSYFIEFVATSKKGLTTSTGLVGFTVVYENPSMYFEVSAETIQETASVKLDWSVKQVIGKTNIPPVYISGNELDVRNGILFFDESYEIERDFTLKLWFRSLSLTKELIYFKGENGEIRLWYSTLDKGFYLYKKVNNFAYNYFYPLNAESNKTFLCIQQKNSRIDVYSENYI